MFWPFWIFWVIDSVKISRHVPKAVHGMNSGQGRNSTATLPWCPQAALIARPEKFRRLSRQRGGTVSELLVCRMQLVLKSFSAEISAIHSWNDFLGKPHNLLLGKPKGTAKSVFVCKNLTFWNLLRHSHWEAATYMACIQKPWTFTQCMEFMMSPLVSPTEKGRISVPVGLKMWRSWGVSGDSYQFHPGILHLPVVYNISQPLSGWWFGTCFIFPYGNNDPNWRTPSFFRGVGIPPTSCSWSTSNFRSSTRIHGISQERQSFPLLGVRRKWPGADTAGPMMGVQFH